MVLNHMMIRYLDKEKKEQTKKLYREAFPEDTDIYVDFYYSVRCENNRILAAFYTKQPVAMLHMNPYRVKFFDREYELYYIVAVATSKDFRRQGLMRALLEKALHDMAAEHKPFTYLMPADKLYYLPFGFTYIFDQPLISIDSDSGLTRRVYSDIYKDKAVDFFNTWFSENAAVYSIRDRAYIDARVKETHAAGGEVYIYCDSNDRINAINFYYGENEERIICRKNNAQIKKSKVQNHPPGSGGIMARITDISEFMKEIRLNENFSDDSMTKYIHVEDAVVDTNAGDWIWHINKTGSDLERAYNTGKDNDITDFTVDELADWLFGYAGKNGNYEKYLNRAAWIAHVKIASQVYFDEET